MAHAVKAADGAPTAAARRRAALCICRSLPGDCPLCIAKCLCVFDLLYAPYTETLDASQLLLVGTTASTGVCESDKWVTCGSSSSRPRDGVPSCAAGAVILLGSSSRLPFTILESAFSAPASAGSERFTTRGADAAVRRRRLRGSDERTALLSHKRRGSRSSLQMS
jgi:hypothetical protein